MAAEIKLDLGLEDVATTGESYLQKDSPLSVKIPSSVNNESEITDQQAIEAGRLLDDSRCISLVFLILPNSEKAFDLCKKIENGRLFPRYTNGEAILLNLAKYTQGDYNSLGWAAKILCALHLLSQYLAIIKIDKRFGPGGCARAKKEYEGVEWHFLDPKRISMYKVCQSLKAKETEALMKRLSFEPAAGGCKTLETMLLGLLRWKGNQEQLLKELSNKLPSESGTNDLYVRTLLSQRAIEKCIQLKRGKCLIVCQKNYEPGLVVEKRDGADHDEEALAKTFRRFGCTIKIERDLPAGGLIEAVKTFREDIRANSSDISYVVVCISSHGRKNEKTGKEEIMGIDGEGVATDELTGMLTDGNQCAELIGKPKLFFIQACRGGTDNDYFQLQNALSVSQLNPNLRPDNVWGLAQDQVPIHSWFMIVHSTLPGHTAWHDLKRGSFFIQSFCHAMKQYGNAEDLEGIVGMTIVSMELGKIRQVPIKYSCLYKNVYFTDYEI